MAARIDAHVDTSAFIAFMDVSDSHHALFRRLFSAPPNACTFPITATSMAEHDLAVHRGARQVSAVSLWSDDDRG